MKPVKFPQANLELHKPPGMTDEECGNLHIHRTQDGQCISCWSVGWWARLKFLFHGKIWLGIVSGASQPPVWLDCTKNVFIEPKNDKNES